MALTTSLNARIQRGTLDMLIARLPKLTHQDLVTLGEATNESICSICLRSFLTVLAEDEIVTASTPGASSYTVDTEPANGHEGVIRLSATCNHIFCREHIRQWIREGNVSCPNCRRALIPGRTICRVHDRRLPSVDVSMAQSSSREARMRSFNEIRDIRGLAAAWPSREMHSEARMRFMEAASLLSFTETQNPATLRANTRHRAREEIGMQGDARLLYLAAVQLLTDVRRASSITREMEIQHVESRMDRERHERRLEGLQLAFISETQGTASQNAETAMSRTYTHDFIGRETTLRYAHGTHYPLIPATSGTTAQDSEDTMSHTQAPGTVEMPTDPLDTSSFLRQTEELSAQCTDILRSARERRERPEIDARSPATPQLLPVMQGWFERNADMTLLRQGQRERERRIRPTESDAVRREIAELVAHRAGSVRRERQYRDSREPHMRL